MRKHISGAGYVVTFVALIILATLSLLLSFLHWRTGGLVVALGIAGAKALLVVWFFMHLAERQFSSRMAVVTSLAFVALLVGLAAADVVTRHTFPPAATPPAGQPFYAR